MESNDLASLESPENFEGMLEKTSREVIRKQAIKVYTYMAEAFKGTTAYDFFDTMLRRLKEGKGVEEAVVYLANEKLIFVKFLSYIENNLTISEIYDVGYKGNAETELVDIEKEIKPVIQELGKIRKELRNILLVIPNELTITSISQELDEIEIKEFGLLENREDKIKFLAQRGFLDDLTAKVLYYLESVSAITEEQAEHAKGLLEEKDRLEIEAAFIGIRIKILKDIVESKEREEVKKYKELKSKYSTFSTEELNNIDTQSLSEPEKRAIHNVLKNRGRLLVKQKEIEDLEQTVKELNTSYSTAPKNQRPKILRQLDRMEDILRETKGRVSNLKAKTLATNYNKYEIKPLTTSTFEDYFLNTNVTIEMLNYCYRMLLKVLVPLFYLDIDCIMEEEGDEATTFAFGDLKLTYKHPPPNLEKNIEAKAKVIMNKLYALEKKQSTFLVLFFKVYTLCSYHDFGLYFPIYKDKLISNFDIPMVGMEDLKRGEGNRFSDNLEVDTVGVTAWELIDFNAKVLAKRTSMLFYSNEHKELEQLKIPNQVELEKYFRLSKAFLLPPPLKYYFVKGRNLNEIFNEIVNSQGTTYPMLRYLTDTLYVAFARNQRNTNYSLYDALLRCLEEKSTKVKKSIEIFLFAAAVVAILVGEYSSVFGFTKYKLLNRRYLKSKKPVYTISKLGQLRPKDIIPEISLFTNSETRKYFNDYLGYKARELYFFYFKALYSAVPTPPVFNLLDPKLLKERIDWKSMSLDPNKDNSLNFVKLLICLYNNKLLLAELTPEGFIKSKEEKKELGKKEKKEPEKEEGKPEKRKEHRKGFKIIKASDEKVKMFKAELQPEILLMEKIHEELKETSNDSYDDSDSDNEIENTIPEEEVFADSDNENEDYGENEESKSDEDN